MLVTSAIIAIQYVKYIQCVCVRAKESLILQLATALGQRVLREGPTDSPTTDHSVPSSFPKLLVSTASENGQEPIFCRLPAPFPHLNSRSLLNIFHPALFALFPPPENFTTLDIHLRRRHVSNPHFPHLSISRAPSSDKWQARLTNGTCLNLPAQPTEP